jgi:hypothetical protein
VGIGHDVPRIAGCAQVAPNELVQPEPFRAGQLDSAADRRATGDIGQGGGNVIGRFGLEEEGGSGTVPSWVLESAMRPMNSKNCVARRIVLIFISCPFFLTRIAPSRMRYYAASLPRHGARIRRNP